MFERLSDGVWRWHDEAGSTAYLVVGRERAAMVDCGADGKPLMPAIRDITALPVDLLLTHAHPDHYGSAAEFERIWLNAADVRALPVLEASFAALGVAPLPRGRLRCFADGQVFGLGGKQLLARALPGHTPGSTVFIDDADRCMFSGDAVGSGDIVLMSVPLAGTLSAYRGALHGFLAATADCGDYRWHAGHCHQAMRLTGECNPPCRALCEDMAALCGALLDGSIRGREVEERFAPQGRELRAYLGRAGIVYCEEQRC